MIHRNTITRSSLAVVVILLMVSPATAAPADAFGGYISSETVTQGDSVEFSGTFHNFSPNNLFLVSFNVSFVERLGETASREPNRPNLTKTYEGNRRVVAPNASLTDTLTENIELDPGSYNVSIFFAFAQAATVSPATVLNSSYALTNRTFTVQGETQALEIAQFIGYVILFIVVATIGILVYNSRFKKSY